MLLNYNVIPISTSAASVGCSGYVVFAGWPQKVSNYQIINKSY